MTSILIVIVHYAVLSFQSSRILVSRSEAKVILTNAAGFICWLPVYGIG